MAGRYTYRTALVLLVIQAFVDLPTNLNITSSISAGGALTVLTLWIAIIAVLISPHTVKSANCVTIAFLPFFLIVLAGIITAPCITALSLQNLTVYCLILVSPILFSSLRDRFISPRRSSRSLFLLLLAAAPACLFLMGYLLLGEYLFAPRSLGAFLVPFAILAVYWFVQFRSKWGLFTAAVCTLAVYLTNSRTAFVVLCVMAAFVWALSGRQRRLARVVCSIIVLGLVVIALVVTNSSMVARFTAGDMVAVGPLHINMMGRWDLWSTTLAGIAEAPITGHGAGQIALYLHSLGFAGSHPHNDFLRILFEYGVLGLVAFVGWLLLLARIVLARREFSPDETPIVNRTCAAAILGAFVALMLTDNVVIYPYVVIPVMALLTLGLPSRKRLVLSSQVKENTVSDECVGRNMKRGRKICSEPRTLALRPGDGTRRSESAGYHA